MIDMLADDSRYHVGSLLYRVTRGRKQERPRVLVNGTPKTGTTWMLRLVRSIPGHRDAGNFNGQIDRYHSISPGDVVHGHDRHTPELAGILRDNQIRVIVMIRDPRDQVISRVYHIRRDASHAWHRQLSAVSLDEALEACIEGRPGLPSTRALVEISQSWMEGSSDCLCIRYEDLLRDTLGEFRRVLETLPVGLPDGLVNAIVKRNHFARLAAGHRFWMQTTRQANGNSHSHFRKGIAGDWHNHFKPHHIERFNALVGDKLVELGYENERPG
jgi:hypothetical protein